LVYFQFIKILGSPNLSIFLVPIPLPFPLIFRLFSVFQIKYVLAQHCWITLRVKFYSLTFGGTIEGQEMKISANKRSIQRPFNIRLDSTRCPDLIWKIENFKKRKINNKKTENKRKWKRNWNWKSRQIGHSQKYWRYILKVYHTPKNVFIYSSDLVILFQISLKFTPTNWFKFNFLQMQKYKEGNL
jgi:hypothetical protein